MDKIIGKNKVLLFFPKIAHQKDKSSILKEWEPLSIVALSSQLSYYGYHAEIFDSRVDKGAEERLNSMAKDLLFIGISAMSGYQVVDGLRFSKFAKKSFPHIPIVWGGWHATVLSDQTIQNPNVDILARGQGEATIVELANALRGGTPIDGIKGLWYKSSGVIHKNPDRLLQDFNNFVPRNYDLLDISKYTIKDGHLHYQTSIGCPYRCSFCGITAYFHQRYNCLTPERVIQELKKLNDKYGLKHVTFYDSLFFIDINRSKEILWEIIQTGFSITWDANTRIDLVLKFDGEMYELIKKSGCHHLSLGIESGSPRILKLFIKDINHEKTSKALEALANNSVPVLANYIISPPTETENEFWETVESIKWVANLNPKNKVVLYRYTPVPGSDMYELEKQEKTVEKVPENLDDWEWFYYRLSSASSIYLLPNDKFKRPCILFYLSVAYLSNVRDKRRGWKSIYFYPIWHFAKFRYVHRWFSFPIEWYVFKVYKRIVL